MTGLDHDPLTAAFDEFRSQAAPFVKPAGADRARADLRTRKRHRAVLLAVVSALVVAIPLVATALVKRDPHREPVNNPQVSVSSAGYFIGPGQSRTPARTAPEGGIAEADLYSAVLDLPAWPAEMSAVPCATGPVRFHGGDTLVNSTNLWIAGVSYADVDGDGRVETFARLFCMGGLLNVASQVVAFTSGPGGVRTLGRVLGQTGDVAAICGVRAGPAGAVQVEVADFPVPYRCADPETAAERYVTRQWLTFTWNGSAFVQQGSAVVTSNPYASDLELTGTDLVLTRQSNGHYAGSLTLTVHNAGRSAVPYSTQTIVVAGMRLIDPPRGCALDPKSINGGMQDVRCTGAKLAGGATRRVTLRIDAPRRYQIHHTPATTVLPANGYNDPDDADDQAVFDIEFRD
jgi:hypothetical protein